jgi:hypothetical protein
MKTNMTGVSRIYRDYLRGAKRDVDWACPTMERLIQCVLADVPEKERAEIVGHAANCAVCAAALKDLLDIAAETDRVAAEIKRPAGREQTGKSKGPAAFWGWMTGRPAVAAIAGIFVLAVLTFSVIRVLDQSGTRGGPEVRVLLISPNSGSFPRDGLEFRWQSLPGAAHYTVELFDKSLKLIWRSGPVSENELRPADVVGKALNLGETYYWMVTAVGGDHSEIKSRLAEFSVKK